MSAKLQECDFYIAGVRAKTSGDESNILRIVNSLHFYLPVKRINKKVETTD